LLARKIIYAGPAEMEKHFYKKIYNITLCIFSAQELAMTIHTTYPIIGHRGFIDFEILQI
jgi:hypothetical protein